MRTKEAINITEYIFFKRVIYLFVRERQWGGAKEEGRESTT